MLPAVPAPHAGASYNPPEVAHTELLRAAHEAELRRVQGAEALEATKAQMLSARHADGGIGDGGAPGMLVDKPGEGVEEQEEQENSVDVTATTTKSAGQRKTKQQRRKAEKQRAEVCGLNPSFFSNVKKKHYSRNMPSWSALCGNGCMRLSTLSRPYARLPTGRKRHE